MGFAPELFLSRNLLRTGRVEVFDEAVGLGAIIDEKGRRFPFHCVVIADGSRAIEVGRRVRFSIIEANLATIEAGAIESLAGE